jgi:hypothetical protein
VGRGVSSCIDRAKMRAQYDVTVCMPGSSSGTVCDSVVSYPFYGEPIRYREVAFCPRCRGRRETSAEPMARLGLLVLLGHSDRSRAVRPSIIRLGVLSGWSPR